MGEIVRLSQSVESTPMPIEQRGGTTDRPRIRLSTDLLVELGYGALTVHQANDLLKELYEAAERIVGERLSGRMSDKQLNTFEEFFKARDDEGAYRWLERNFPDYREIVQNTFDELTAELHTLAHSAGSTSVGSI